MRSSATASSVCLMAGLHLLRPATCTAYADPTQSAVWHGVIQQSCHQHKMHPLLMKHMQLC